MDHLLAVAIVDCMSQLQKELSCFAFRQSSSSSLLIDVLSQLSSRHVLHDEDDIVLMKEGVIKFDDVGMRELF